jgi:hypothetical protein
LKMHAASGEWENTVAAAAAAAAAGAVAAAAADAAHHGPIGGTKLGAIMGPWGGPHPLSYVAFPRDWCVGIWVWMHGGSMANRWMVPCVLKTYAKCYNTYISSYKTHAHYYTTQNWKYTDAWTLCNAEGLEEFEGPQPSLHWSK